MSEKEKNEQIDLNEMKKLRDEFSDTKGKFTQELENIKVEFSKKLNATKDKIVNVVSKNPQKVIAMASLLTIGASMVALDKKEKVNVTKLDNGIVAISKLEYDDKEKVDLSNANPVEILSDEEISRIEKENGIEISNDDVVTRLSNGIISISSGRERDEIKGTINLYKENAVEVLSNEELEQMNQASVKKMSDEELDKMLNDSEETIVKLSNGIVAVSKGKQKDTVSEKVNLDKENSVEVTSSSKDEIEKLSDSSKNGIEELSDDELDKFKEETEDKIIRLKNGIIAVIKGSSQTRKRIDLEKEKAVEITAENDIEELSDNELDKLKKETDDMER